MFEFSFFTAAAPPTTFLQVCFPGLKPCKRWDENCWGKKSFEMLSFLSFKRANLHFTDVHLHSYCRMFFHSWVYNTYFSKIYPHSCQPASHMISGSFFISQLWSETLKLWKQTVWKLLEAEALSCNPLYWELEIKRPPKEKSATERSTFKSETQSLFLCCKLSSGTTVCKTSANVHPQKFQNEDLSFRNSSFNVSKLFFPNMLYVHQFSNHLQGFKPGKQTSKPRKQWKCWRRSCSCEEGKPKHNNNVCRDLNFVVSQWKHDANLQNLVSILQNLV